jgi:hypothetical protein
MATTPTLTDIPVLVPFEDAARRGRADCTPLFDLVAFPADESTKRPRRAKGRRARAKGRATTPAPDLFSGFVARGDTPRTEAVWQEVVALWPDLRAFVIGVARRHGGATREEIATATNDLAAELARQVEQLRIRAAAASPKPGTPTSAQELLATGLLWSVVVRSLVKQRAAAAGVSREAYIRAGRRRRGVDAPDALPVRVQAAEGGLAPLPPADELPAAAGATPEEAIIADEERAERRAQLRQLLAQLPEELQVAALEAIDIPRGRWAKRHYRALAALQRAAGVEPVPALLRGAAGQAGQRRSA